jgi:Icc-related predicted phosphoesterase
MKILHVADLHYTLKQFDWLVAQRDQYELIIIGGDLLDLGGFLERDVQTVVVEKYFQKLVQGGQLGVISGNHDYDIQVDDEHVAEWIQKCRDYGMHVDGDDFIVDEVQIVLLPWVNGPETEKRAEEQLNRAAEVDAARRLWAFHEPPDQSPVSWNGKRYFGSKILVDWIKRWEPDLVVGGHVHNAPFYGDGDWKDRIGKTWVFNPGKQIGPVPCMIEFDLDTMTASWDSLEGKEELKLTDR